MVIKLLSSKICSRTKNIEKTNINLSQRNLPIQVIRCGGYPRVGTYLVVSNFLLGTQLRKGVDIRG